MLTCNHIVVKSAKMQQAREFYIEKLGLHLLGGTDTYFGARVGEMRLSFFPLQDENKSECRIDLILRTNDITIELERIRQAGIEVPDGIIEAPDFMKFFTIIDPDNNVVHIAEYLRDPLETY